MQRREFLQGAVGVGGVMLVSPWLRAMPDAAASLGRVAFVKTTNRAEGVARAIKLLGVKPFGGKSIFLKPNFNSSDTTPGSTHPDTLAALAAELKRLGAGALTIGDRSGMGNTRGVMEARNAFAIAKDAGGKAIVFDELSESDWQHKEVAAMHWQRGFALPKPVLAADAIVTTCCLKTHRYGGHFSLSLKNSVGLAAKQIPGDSYNYMRELHGSEHQRRMIAEINSAYAPALVVIDGVQGFADGGPDRGRLVESNVILAGTDRIALDAVGVALLRHFGTTPEVQQGPIFQQQQIARAVELKLGVTGPEQIVLLTDDDASAQYAKQIRGILDAKAA